MLLATKHILTEVDALKIEPSDAEVTFVGRSNAGKSALINALCQKRNMAHVSQAPGKTRTINVYEVKLYRWIVDLPGYGYATGSRSERAQLGSMVEGYLKSRKNLCMVFVVLDAVAGPTKLDSSMINWLKHNACPFSVIVNKIDKVGPSKLAVRKKEIVDELSVDNADIFWVSAIKKSGIEALRNVVAQLLGV